MTEERMDELTKEWIETKKRNDWQGIDTKIADLIRTVATESRKEGIEEMRDAIHGFCAAGIAEKAAERLKEQKS